MKFERTLRSGVIAMLFAGVWTVGCGAESPEVPEDGDDDNGGTGMGGTFPQGGVAQGGTCPQGGSLPQGGASTGGTFPSGGASTGGTFPMGGTTPTSGAGGGGGCGPTAATGTDAPIDDLEDGENAIIAPRVGY